MSGKPASVAPRAGGANAPRVLVYVAEARQLEARAAGPDPPPAPHLAPRGLYRPQDDIPATVYYKPFSDTEPKTNSFDSNSCQRGEFFPTQFVKENCVQADENKDRPSSVKRDCDIAEWSNDTYVRIPLPLGEFGYQRCPTSVDSSMSMVPVVHQSQFHDSVVHSDDRDCGDRELVAKSLVNYQLLEQSVSHQSIVNQSINILNQQVGVSRVVGEDAPQLVRTADGVVLAVLPSVLSQSEAELRTVHSELPQTVTVPLGWRRIVNGTSVLYVSPSGTALSNLSQLRDYLQTSGTCKCGLPCPLRPETAFSFDPKVVSKPYQVAAGAELTKLCNHKRKLLASLQSRVQSPVTPPPQTIEQKKVPGAETAKKKMKKRSGFVPAMSVSQMMVQRERPLNEFKPDNDQKRTASPGAMPQRTGTVQSYLPYSQHMLNAVQDDAKQETHVQRSSHYLTVSSGWITHQPEMESSPKPNQATSGPINNTINIGQPVLGTNGQVIGVNTGYNKHITNVKSALNVPLQNMMEQDHKEDEKDSQAHKQQKDEESQIFCGLNQPLTPEVMQKINEQQQIFIQRNQKQIEVMKGYKTQMTEHMSQNKSIQNHYVPQGQLVIQNGAVVKTNSAKTPPWQVKRNDCNPSTSLMCPSPKLQRLENIEYDDTSISTFEDSSSSSGSFVSNEQIMNPSMCSRVPPLPQHYNMMTQQWPGVDLNKKKIKCNKAPKKKAALNENKPITYGNNGMRQLQDKAKPCDDIVRNAVPSFMDDPNGYLAQQTVLLNNTISRQVGMSNQYDVNQFDNASTPCNSQPDKNLKSTPKQGEHINVFRNNVVPNPLPSPNNTPDSSLVPDKSFENNMPQCCKDCNVPYKGNCIETSDNQMRAKFLKHHPNIYGRELESGAATTSSPKHAFDDNPVTSSTYIERNIMMNDNCGPIQAGIVSTSNVSPNETLQQPEPSPTPSNSSRSTDTPHSSGSNSQLQNNCSYPIQSPVYSNPGSSRDNYSSNPSTPGSNHTYPYNSPGPPISQSVSGNQVMHFISNHNVNKNLMEVDNISMVGVKPGLKNQQEILRLEPKKRIENAMPGYCPPPHLGGGPAHSLIQACYIQTFVTTMASGFSVTRDTVTSVLAGKASTATTSINASQANFIRPPPPPSVNLATSYAIPNHQPDPFINSVNLPTSYPLHIAGTTAQSMISKSPLEMVQNVISNIPSKSETSNTQSSSIPQRRACSTPGQILISSTGQILVSTNQMLPPPPKNTTAISPMGSSVVTSNTSSLNQVVPAVGGVQPIVNQSTVMVNNLPTPFVIQPPMMAVDGQVVQQNSVLPQIVAGGIVPGQQSNESQRQIEVKNGQGFVPGVAMLSPESLKKRSKKKKTQVQNITNVLQISAPQQNPNNIMVHHSSPQHNSSPQFSPRGFQLSPTNNISPTPMLQALTIVPGKSGTPAHIVMNGQGNTNNYASQQLITNTSPSQQINLLQPVNLINNANNVMSNFPAFQQFILPNLGGMVMTADGTAIIQDNSTGMPMQLQLQTVNGQNVLTPVQNPGLFTTGTNSGVVIRAQNQQGKIIQSQHSPGAQFLSPNSQVMMNSPNFNGQLSPLLTNLSPTNVGFNASPQVRSGNVQTQEFIQTNQMGQTLMVPLSPKQVPISATNNRTNSTFVQNTTIVQQQTTLVSNSHNAQNMNMQSGNSRLSIDPNILLNQKPVANPKRFNQLVGESSQVEFKEDKGSVNFDHGLKDEKPDGSEEYARLMQELGGVRHSVSTQTLGQRGGKSPNMAGGSPPDTTTHSPLGALDAAPSPRIYAAASNYADTTTKSPEPADIHSSAMVQCVSSSEQDMAESRERAWPAPRSDISSDSEHNMMSNIQLMRMNRTHNSVESSEIQYNQSINPSNSQHVLPMTSTLYDRPQSYKRKNDFGDGSTYRNDKIMRSNYGMVHGMPKDYDMSMSQEKQRRFSPSGSNSESSSIQKVFDRHLGSDNDSKSEDESDDKSQDGSSDNSIRRLEVGDLVWGPVKGYASWPGKLEARVSESKWSVRWFGDRSPGEVEHSRLLTLCEGLEAHHAARMRHRKSRKLNTLLENAIQEAMAELDKQTETNEPDESTEHLADIMETPKRKHHKLKNKHKKTPAKVDGTRLRSSR
ncbi:methyl-CpG-binding domain protein 5-like [Maniola hyperantus]|uniref:methyl-CpG-binding domain protein 5-like n=1 Tax=Aphantopus hyperantus TaxID=2795564 RepID=UPI00212892D4